MMYLRKPIELNNIEQINIIAYFPEKLEELNNNNTERDYNCVFTKINKGLKPYKTWNRF